MGRKHTRKARRGSPPKFGAFTTETRAAFALLEPCPEPGCLAPANVRCHDEAGNPLTGGGAHRARRDLATLQVHL